MSGERDRYYYPPTSSSYAARPPLVSRYNATTPNRPTTLAPLSTGYTVPPQGSTYQGGGSYGAAAVSAWSDSSGDSRKPSVGSSISPQGGNTYSGPYGAAPASKWSYSTDTSVPRPSDGSYTYGSYTSQSPASLGGVPASPGQMDRGVDSRQSPLVPRQPSTESQYTTSSSLRYPQTPSDNNYRDWNYPAGLYRTTSPDRYVSPSTAPSKASASTFASTSSTPFPPGFEEIQAFASPRAGSTDTRASYTSIQSQEMESPYDPRLRTLSKVHDRNRIGHDGDHASRPRTAVPDTELERWNGAFKREAHFYDNPETTLMNAEQEHATMSRSRMAQATTAATSGPSTTRTMAPPNFAGTSAAPRSTGPASSGVTPGYSQYSPYRSVRIWAEPTWDEEPSRNKSRKQESRRR